MDKGLLIIDVDAQGTGWLILNRPEVRNAFDDRLIAGLLQALRDLEKDPKVRAVAIAARGSSFSAGADLGWMRRMAEAGFEENVADAMGLAELLHALDRLPKPTVAVVQGSAYGGGVGLIAACDIAVAVETARFALTEVRLGLIPAVISPYVIRAIGPRHARRCFLTGETLDAVEALRIGLIHSAVPPVELRAEAERALDALAGNGPQAMAAAKELIRAVADRPIDEALMRDTAERIARARASDEARARIAAFLGKRQRTPVHR